MMVFEFECPGCYAVETAPTSDAEVYCGCTRQGYRMKRVYSLGGIHFKGSGFYCNDSKKQSVQ